MNSTSSTAPATSWAILELLESDGPQLAAHLANALGLTAMEVRQHLYALLADGKVEWSPASGGVPAKLWAVAGAARGASGSQTRIAS